MIEIIFDKSKNKSFAYDNNTQIGECDFIELDGCWNIIHTEVDGSYQGQGIARKLVESIIENAKKYNKNISAECSYAKKVIENEKKRLKMLAGELYDANYDKELLSMRTKAKELCLEYNNLNPNDINTKKEVLKKLFQKSFEQCIIEPNFYCDYGFNIEFGKNFYANHNLVILDANKVKFGDNVFIGPNCGFYTSGHPLDYETRNNGLEYAKPIIVGNNVWIGGNVCVMPGVTIGNNVVIGAGSVVTKDIPSNVVAVGNPCKVLKEI